ncbi:MAG: energy transducer TonB [Psychrobium sp.]
MRIEPKYPRETIAEQGWVKLSYRVNSSGYVQEIEVVDVSEKGGFGDEAKIALSQWLFLPAEDASGVPIMSEVMTIGFSVRIEP